MNIRKIVTSIFPKTVGRIADSAWDSGYMNGMEKGAQELQDTINTSLASQDLKIVRSDNRKATPADLMNMGVAEEELPKNVIKHTFKKK